IANRIRTVPRMRVAEIAPCYTGRMPRTCTVCRHPDRESVNAALVASEPERAIASRFGLSRCALQRHKANHLPVLLTKAVAEAEIVEAETLVGRMQTLE